MQCPTCNTTLRTVTYEGIQIETCTACTGEWLDRTELKHIVDAREERFSPEERQAVARAAKITGVDIEREDRDLICPKCGGQTDAVNYGGDSGVVIDKCTGCGGIWLDGGELEKVQMLVEGWEDGLPDDLAQYGKGLHNVAREVDERTKVRVSRFGFVNAIINGIVDLVD